MKKILGSDFDLKFASQTSKVEQIDKSTFVTLSLGEDSNVHMLRFYANRGRTHFEVRSVKDYGPR